jgi:hypothetical protein
MLVDGMLVVVGAMTSVWGMWLLPRQLNQARNKMSPEGQAYMDDLFQRRAARRFLFVMSALCGGLLMLTGVVFLAFGG